MRKKFLNMVLIMLIFTVLFSVGFGSEVQAKNGFFDKPTSSDGFKAGKNGQKAKVGNDYGWKDAKGRIWIPDGKMHGGKGWVRQYPNGSHDHVYQGGNVRSHNISGEAGHKKSKINCGLATLFWTKLLRTRNYFNYSSYPADFRVFNPLYSTGVR